MNLSGIISKISRPRHIIITVQETKDNTKQPDTQTKQPENKIEEQQI